MSPENLVRILLVAFAVAGIVYVWTASDMRNKTNRDWWNDLSRPKRVILVLAVVATLVQTLI